MQDTQARLQKPEAIALAGLAALAVAMGIGRFAFTPLLPMMQADAGLTLAQGGWLASANYAGYLAGALWAAAQPVRQRLNGLITAFVGSGARTETMSAPTETMRATLAEAKADLAAIEKEIK